VKSQISSPLPINPNLDIPEEMDVVRFNIPWEHSARLGFIYSVDQIRVYTNGEEIILSANELEDVTFYDYATPYFHKENGNPASTDVDPNYDSQFIFLPKKDFGDWYEGQTITYTYVDPCGVNKVFSENLPKTTVLEGERHIVISKGDGDGLDTTNDTDDGEVLQMDREGHSTVQESTN